MSCEYERFGVDRPDGTAEKVQIDTGIRLHRAGNIGNEHNPPRLGGTPTAQQMHRVTPRAMRSPQGRAHIDRSGGSMPACSTAATQGWHQRELFDQALQ